VTGPQNTLLLVSGLLKVGATLLILLMFAKLGWDLASGRQVEIPPILIIAIGATLAAQLATWAGWRFASGRETEDRGR
jgi:hypothetical protein